MKKILSILVLAFMCLFGLFACGEEELPEDLKQAKEYVERLYKNDKLETSADFERPAVYKDITLEWSVNVTDDKVKVVSAADGKTVTIDVDEETESDIEYVLKVTLKNKDGKTAELTWEHKVPKLKISTWEEYAALEKDKPVVVEGIVTTIIGKANGNSSNCLYLQDKENKGAYYVYGMSEDPSAADSPYKLGTTVRCAGLKDIYSGTLEIKNGSCKVVDETIKAVTPVDYTDLFTAAKDCKDASITAAQGLLVTVKGVTIKDATEDKGYYNFTLAGKESYIRISSSVCPLSKADQNTFKAEFSKHIGWTADATGVICVYDGNFYLTPVTVNAYEYKSLPVLDDAGMVAFEKEKLSFDTEITEAKEVNVPVAGPSYTAVAIAWASSNETLAKVEEGKVVFAEAEEDTEITLTATLTSGEVTETKEFKVKVIAPVSDLLEVEAIEKAYALEAGKKLTGKQVIAGEIVSIDTAYNAEYKNITVTIKPDALNDGEHNIQCFRLVGGEDLAVDDHIVVTGTLMKYQPKTGDPYVEFEAKCTYSKTLTVAEVKGLVAVKAAVALEAGKKLNYKSQVTGEIVSIDTAYNAEYKNITVTIKPVGATDDTLNVQCFRLVGGEDLAVGDKIIVTGTLMKYQPKTGDPYVEFEAKCTYVKVATPAGE